ncbi:hypothetical protein [Streptomyces sp. NPDC053542]|uniref:hypothetical protein n=1 Tax=Streptomyces sp. NPDC053542 TaxID=3365710 RepID=UPI0037D00C9A
MPAPCALSLALGLWGVRRQDSIWRDEVVTYDMAHRGLPELWDTLQNADAVHGFYYLFMHALFDVFGGGVLTLRLPSVLAMTAAAAGVALLGARVAGERAGLAAGLVFPLLPLVQQYAQEGRSYALVCALVTWSTYLLVRALAASPATVDAPGPGLFGVPGPARRWWTAYVVVTLAACLLHEFAVLVLAAHGTTVVLADVPCAVRHAVRRTWLVAAGVVAAGLAPLALFSAGQSAQLSWALWPDPVQLVTFGVLAVVGVTCARVPVRARGPVRTCGPVWTRGPVRTCESVRAREPVRARGPVGLGPLAVPLLIAPPAALMLLSQLQPMFVDRYVLYYVVGFALLAGAALDRVFRPLGDHGDRAGRADRARRRRAVWALVAVLVALLPAAVYLRSPQSRTDDATAVVRAVRAVAEPGDGLLFMPARRRVWTRSEPERFRDLTDLALSREPDSARSLYGTEVPADRIRARMLGSERIVVLSDPRDEPEDETSGEITKRTTLRDAFTPCRTQDVTGARITVYARPGHCDD